MRQTYASKPSKKLPEVLGLGWSGVTVVTPSISTLFKWVFPPKCSRAWNSELSLMLQTVQKPKYTTNIERHQHSFTTPVLSNHFGTAGRILINLEVAGRNSKQRLKFSEHYKLHGSNAGPMKNYLRIIYLINYYVYEEFTLALYYPPRRWPPDHWSTVDNAQRRRLIIVKILGTISLLN